MSNGVLSNAQEDQDILLTGTCESIHALSEEEWKKNKAENDARKQLQQKQDEQRQMKQFHKLDHQQKQQQRQQQQRQQQQQKQRQQQQQQPASSLSYATMTGKNLSPKKKNAAHPPSPKLVNWAQRLLTPATDSSAYTFVYMGSPRRTLHSEIRKALRLVDVAPERVIDIQFPAHGTVGLLIHSSYEKELRELLAQAKLTPKDGFNPIAATTIGDPTLLAKLSEEERSTEARKLYQERMLAICSRMPKKHLGIAILRHFSSLPQDDHHHIGQEYWDKFQAQHPKPVTRRRNFQLTTQEDAHNLLSNVKVNNNEKPEPMEE